MIYLFHIFNKIFNRIFLVLLLNNLSFFLQSRLSCCYDVSISTKLSYYLTNQIIYFIEIFIFTFLWFFTKYSGFSLYRIENFNLLIVFSYCFLALYFVFLQLPNHYFISFIFLNNKYTFVQLWLVFIANFLNQLLKSFF